LELWNIGKLLLDLALENRGVDEMRGLIKALGLLPLGNQGNCLFDEMLKAVDSLINEIAAHLKAAARTPLHLDLVLAPAKLTGMIGNLRESGLVRYTYSKLSASNKLEQWIRHLAWCATAKPHQPWSIFIGRGEKNSVETVVFAKPNRAAETILEELLDLYLKGQETPLPFFPAASLAYAEKIAVKKEHDEALQAALIKWNSNKRNFDATEAVKRIFGERNPLGDDRPEPGLRFPELAMKIFTPLLVNASEWKQ
jgi:exodeoxyribonuclease V gamma subunit